MRATFLAVLFSFVVTASAAELPEGVRRIKVLNYAACLEHCERGAFSRVKRKLISQFLQLGRQRRRFGNDFDNG